MGQYRNVRGTTKWNELRDYKNLKEGKKMTRRSCIHYNGTPACDLGNMECIQCTHFIHDPQYSKTDCVHYNGQVNRKKPICKNGFRYCSNDLNYMGERCPEYHSADNQQL